MKSVIFMIDVHMHISRLCFLITV